MEMTREGGIHVFLKGGQGLSLSISLPPPRPFSVVGGGGYHDMCMSKRPSMAHGPRPGNYFCHRVIFCNTTTFSRLRRNLRGMYDQNVKAPVNKANEPHGRASWVGMERRPKIHK